jgi:hypothetical protein
MAQWRKRFEDQPPTHLVEFDPADWVASGYLGKSAWQPWSDARFEWLLKHKGQTINGMTAVEVIFEEP